MKRSLLSILVVAATLTAAVGTLINVAAPGAVAEAGIPRGCTLQRALGDGTVKIPVAKTRSLTKYIGHSASVGSQHTTDLQLSSSIGGSTEAQFVAATHGWPETRATGTFVYYVHATFRVGIYRCLKLVAYPGSTVTAEERHTTQLRITRHTVERTGGVGTFRRYCDPLEPGHRMTYTTGTATGSTEGLTVSGYGVFAGGARGETTRSSSSTSYVSYARSRFLCGDHRGPASSLYAGSVTGDWKNRYWTYWKPRGPISPW